MAKIRNRFTPGDIITILDNLLCDLYSLNRDGGFEWEKEFNGDRII